MHQRSGRVWHPAPACPLPCRLGIPFDKLFRMQVAHPFERKPVQVDITGGAKPHPIVPIGAALPLISRWRAATTAGNPRYTGRRVLFGPPNIEIQDRPRITLPASAFGPMAFTRLRCVRASPAAVMAFLLRAGSRITLMAAIQALEPGSTARASVRFIPRPHKPRPSYPSGNGAASGAPCDALTIQAGRCRSARI